METPDPWNPEDSPVDIIVDPPEFSFPLSPGPHPYPTSMSDTPTHVAEPQPRPPLLSMPNISNNSNTAITSAIANEPDVSAFLEDIELSDPNTGTISVSTLSSSTASISIPTTAMVSPPLLPSPPKIPPVVPVTTTSPPRQRIQPQLPTSPPIMSNRIDIPRITPSPVKIQNPRRVINLDDPEENEESASEPQPTTQIFTTSGQRVVSGRSGPNILLPSGTFTSPTPGSLILATNILQGIRESEIRPVQTLPLPELPLPSSSSSTITPIPVSKRRAVEISVDITAPRTETDAPTESAPSTTTPTTTMVVSLPPPRRFPGPTMLPSLAAIPKRRGRPHETVYMSFDSVVFPSETQLKLRAVWRPLSGTEYPGQSVTYGKYIPAITTLASSEELDTRTLLDAKYGMPTTVSKIPSTTLYIGAISHINLFTRHNTSTTTISSATIPGPPIPGMNYYEETNTRRLPSDSESQLWNAYKTMGSPFDAITAGVNDCDYHKTDVRQLSEYLNIHLFRESTPGIYVKTISFSSIYGTQKSFATCNRSSQVVRVAYMLVSDPDPSATFWINKLTTLYVLYATYLIRDTNVPETFPVFNFKLDDGYHTNIEVSQVIMTSQSHREYLVAPKQFDMFNINNRLGWYGSAELSQFSSYSNISNEMNRRFHFVFHIWSMISLADLLDRALPRSGQMFHTATSVEFDYTPTQQIDGSPREFFTSKTRLFHIKFECVDRSRALQRNILRTILLGSIAVTGFMSDLVVQQYPAALAFRESVFLAPRAISAILSDPPHTMSGLRVNLDIDFTKDIVLRRGFMMTFLSGICGLFDDFKNLLDRDYVGKSTAAPIVASAAAWNTEEIRTSVVKTINSMTNPTIWSVLYTFLRIYELHVDTSTRRSRKAIDQIIPSVPVPSTTESSVPETRSGDTSRRPSQITTRANVALLSLYYVCHTVLAALTVGTRKKLNSNGGFCIPHGIVAISSEIENQYPVISGVHAFDSSSADKTIPLHIFHAFISVPVFTFNCQSVATNATLYLFSRINGSILDVPRKYVFNRMLLPNLVIPLPQVEPQIIADGPQTQRECFYRVSQQIRYADTMRILGQFGGYLTRDASRVTLAIPTDVPPLRGDTAARMTAPPPTFSDQYSIPVPSPANGGSEEPQFTVGQKLDEQQ